MLKSMTGFGKAEDSNEEISVSVEIKSLNNRFLDVNCKLPRELFSREFQIRDLFKNRISRGSINIFINFERKSSALPFSMDFDAVTEAYKSLDEIKKKLKLKSVVSMENILVFSNFFQKKVDIEISSVEWNFLQKTISKAINELDKTRRNEGKQLEKDINARLKNISMLLEDVEKLSMKRIPEERDRLRQRISTLFDSDEIDEQRLQMEIVFLADKLDVSEECVRLRSHLKFFAATLRENEPTGRKINFLLQEINRETNTIGSKINDAAISQIVVGMKEEIERIREQAQNIE